jgi:hypothetical protein
LWDVFNVEVDGAHQYYVSQRQVLFHNANGFFGTGQPEGLSPIQSGPWEGSFGPIESGSVEGAGIPEAAESAAVDSGASAPMTGYTWNQVLQARYGAANVEWAAPNLASDPLTLGVLRTPAGDFDLASGWNGYGGLMPKGASGFDIVTRTHVEGQAAALMQTQGISEGTLYINNPAICPSCMRNLPYMLGPGRSLEVVPLNGAGVPFAGSTR